MTVVDEKRKKIVQRGIGCCLLILAAPFGLCPFVVMTGSDLKGSDGIIFVASMALAFCLFALGIFILIRSAKADRR